MGVNNRSGKYYVECNQYASLRKSIFVWGLLEVIKGLVRLVK